MKTLVAIFVMLMLIFGCSMPGDSGTNQTNGTATDTPKPVKPTVAPPVVEPIQNETDVEEVNNTPDDPFAGIIPRNISDRIGDGQFRMIDSPGEPFWMYVINDGNADSILIKKGSFYMLIDAGNSEQVMSFLNKLRITRINVVVATRDDDGAVGGMEDIIRNYKVDEFWDNGVDYASDGYMSLLSAVKAIGIPIKHPVSGDYLFVQGMRVEILNPKEIKMGSNADLDAIVMKLNAGGFCAVLLNPTVQERENDIIGSNDDLRCDVVTYFKHGEGRPMPSLLISDYVKPKDAIISVGPNDNKLPSAMALSWLDMKGIKAWRTDKNGTVVINTDGMGTYTIGRYDMKQNTTVDTITR